MVGLVRLLDVLAGGPYLSVGGLMGCLLLYFVLWLGFELVFLYLFERLVQLVEDLFLCHLVPLLDGYTAG